MKGLTGKVFRTYNASITLDRLLKKGEENNQLSKMTLEQKLAEYQRANKEVTGTLFLSLSFHTHTHIYIYIYIHIHLYAL